MPHEPVVAGTPILAAWGNHVQASMIHVLGYAEKTSNQGPIGSGVVDVTDLSATVDVKTGERLRITADIAVHATSGIMSLFIREGSTVLQERWIAPSVVQWHPHRATVIVAPSAGAHTYKVSITASTATIQAKAGAPSFLLVESLGVWT
jgi:hypothetical protein